jgi:hypothetical protein
MTDQDTPDAETATPSTPIEEADIEALRAQLRVKLTEELEDCEHELYLARRAVKRNQDRVDEAEARIAELHVELGDSPVTEHSAALVQPTPRPHETPMTVVEQPATDPAEEKSIVPGMTEDTTEHRHGRTAGLRSRFQSFRDYWQQKHPKGRIL